MIYEITEKFNIYNLSIRKNSVSVIKIKIII